MKLVSRCAYVLFGLACGLALHASAIAKADPSKVVRVTFEAADDGFDVQLRNSVYSTWVGEAIFENLLTYDYLARPAKLMPGTAESMPVVSNDGKTYEFHLKKGIYFTPDAAFKGKRRELVAADYAYTIRRLVDPKNRSPSASSFDGKIVGLDAVTAAARKTGKFDYDAPVAGLETPDPYTLRIHLIAPDQTMQYLLADSHTSASAREVIEMYGDDAGRHPVGTGPYLLKDYTPRSKIVLEANPDYRGFIWDFKSTGSAWDDQIVRDMRGKHMPQVGRVEINIIEEDQSRWLAFESGQTDLELIVNHAAPKVLDKDMLKPQYRDKGISLYRFAEAGITYTYFNFKDPVTGGYTPDKVALRRAIAMSYQIDDEIKQVFYGQAIRAQSQMPPGVAGHDPKYRPSIQYDPALAIKLLDHFNYRVGPNGYRTMPDGSPLVLKIHSAPHARDKARMEIWKRSLDRIGIKAEFPISSFADNLKAAYRCELMMFGLGGTAGIPDGIDFVQSYYGPNAGIVNKGCYQSAGFDEAYNKARLLPDGPERQVYYEKMQRQIEADTAIVLHAWRIRNWVVQPWIKGFKRHPIYHADWMYLDVDNSKKSGKR